MAPSAARLGSAAWTRGAGSPSSPAPRAGSGRARAGARRRRGGRGRRRPTCAPTRIDAGDRVVARPLDVGDEAATVALVEEITTDARPDRPVVRQRRRRRRRRAPTPPTRLWACSGGQRDVPRLRGPRPAAGLDRPRRGPPRHDGVDGRHPHVARRRRLRGDEARRPRVRRVAGDHPRRPGRQGLVRLPRRVDTPMLRGAPGDADKAAAVIGGGEVLSPDEAAAR